MKRMIAALLIAALAASPAFAKSKRKTPLPQRPHLIQCAFWLGNHAGCSSGERIAGSVVLTGLTGLAIGSGFGAAGLGAMVGIGAGAVEPMIAR